MSLYNMINGMNAEAAFMLSIYLNMNVQEEFPRFRNVFLQDDDCPYPKDKYDFLVYTRMGGGNRECWGTDNNGDECDCPACKADQLEDEEFIYGRWDDTFDATYSTFAIKLSEEQKNISTEVKAERMKTLFPELYKKFF